MSTSILQRILKSTRNEVQLRKQKLPLSELQAQESPRRQPWASERPFRSALIRPGISVIAEFKRRSPSAGSLSEHPDMREVIGAYRRGGACAVSVLTEGPNFGGSLEDLYVARQACDLPILRKDFILDPYQLYEALAWGADAVLLIVAALDRPQLTSLHDRARDLGLDVLVEVHDRDELLRALSVKADLIGINNRDLRDFSVDIQRTAQLMGEIPDSVAVVSESGIKTPEQLQHLQALGVGAVLVGETLMRAPDPEASLRILRGESADPSPRPTLNSFRQTEDSL